MARLSACDRRGFGHQTKLDRREERVVVLWTGQLSCRHGADRLGEKVRIDLGGNGFFRDLQHEGYFRPFCHSAKSSRYLSGSGKTPEPETWVGAGGKAQVQLGQHGSRMNALAASGRRDPCKLHGIDVRQRDAAGRADPRAVQQLRRHGLPRRCALRGDGSRVSGNPQAVHGEASLPDPRGRWPCSPAIGPVRLQFKHLPRSASSGLQTAC